MPERTDDVFMRGMLRGMLAGNAVFIVALVLWLALR